MGEKPLPPVDRDRGRERAMGDSGSKRSCVGAGAEGVGDLVPGVAVGAGIVDELGKEAFGLVGEAGDEGYRGEVVAEPEPAAFSEDCEGVVDGARGCCAALSA
jgi:hypothetical protein